MRRDEPPRLGTAGSDGPEALAELVQAGRDELPSAAQLARLAKRFPIGRPPPDGGSPPEAHPPPMLPPAPSVVPAALIGAALGLATVGGAWWLDSRSVTPPAGAPEVVATVEDGGDDRPREQRNEGAVTAQPAPTPAPSATALRPGTATVPEPWAPMGETPADGGVPEGVAPASPPARETEAQMLRRAQIALDGDPARALHITGEHVQQFPGGNLAEEREFIAIAALSALGRSAEARERAVRLIRQHPQSAHRRKIEALVPGLADFLSKD